MEVARIVSDWLGVLIAADGSVSGISESVTDGDGVSADRISVVWRESVEPTAPPLHIYDLEFEVRRPKETDLTATQGKVVADFVKGAFTAENFATLVTDLAGIGTLNDWFVGESGETERDERNYTKRRMIRLAIVHS